MIHKGYWLMICLVVLLGVYPAQSQQTGYGLVFVSEDIYPSSDLYLLDPVTGQGQFLTHVIDELQDRFVISSDCASDGKIFFSTGGSTQFYIIPPNTALHPILNMPQRSGIAIHPNGTTLAVGDFKIYVGDYSGTTFTPITSGDNRADFPDWSPDGSQIVFQFRRDENIRGIAIVNSDGSNRHTIWQSLTSWVGSPDWSPDGQKIAFYSDLNGTDQIYLINVDGSGLTQLTTEGRNYHPVWSPDGQWIAFTSTRNGYEDYWQLYVMRPDGTDVRLMTSTAFEYRSNYMQCWLPLDNMTFLTPTPTFEPTSFPTDTATATNTPKP